MQIIPATTPDHIETVRELFTEYAAWIRTDLCFQGFSREVSDLPGLYAPPRGRLLLARVGEKTAGCIALRPAGDRVCEMKRLFVRPEFHGLGLGRALAERVVTEAREASYAAMILDTLPFMSSAIRLYESLGFVRRAPYYDTPVKDTIFMELAL